jgi:hypothetical protein
MGLGFWSHRFLGPARRRVQAILTRANRDLNVYVGIECKPWISRIVKDATGVTVPSTSPDAYGWSWSASNHFNQVWGIGSAVVGDFVQLNYVKGRPHTFLITSVSSTGVNVIESNWSKSLMVTSRFIPFTDGRAGRRPGREHGRSGIRRGSPFFDRCSKSAPA